MASELHRVEVPVRADRREIVAAQLWMLGAVGVWEQPGTTVAWFQAPLPSLPADPPAGLATELSDEALRWRREPDRDWQADWKATIAPVRAGRMVIVPSWLAGQHERASDDELVLVLDPGRAFGTGHHATTALCLELLDELDQAGRLAGQDVADIGCGSGILAIAAAARGARVVAVDVDADAVEVTGENAARNDVEVTAMPGSAGDLHHPVRIVVANLLSDVIADLADELVAACREVLVVSGITAERADDVLATLAEAGAEVEELRSRDGWIAARLRIIDPSGTRQLVEGRAGQPAAPRDQDRAGGHAHDPTEPRAGDRSAGHASGRRRVVARTHTRAAALLMAGALLLGTACTTPQVRSTAADEPATTETQQRLDPAAQALLDEVEEARALVAQIRTELEAASSADELSAVRAAADAADQLLVATADNERQALLPGEPAERTERPEIDAAFTVLLTQARQLGGTLGRDLVESLRDPIAGDLGAWELDAPGVVATARDTAAGAADVEAAAEQVLALVGEASRAIAWVHLARTSEDVELARLAAVRATDHLEVIDIALGSVVESNSGPAPAEAGTRSGEELGPSVDAEADG